MDATFKPHRSAIHVEPAGYLVIIALIVLVYLFAAEVAKRMFYRWMKS